MNVTPEQVTTILGLLGAVVTAILTAIGVNVAAHAYSTRVNADVRRNNAVAAAEVRRKKAETEFLREQTRAKTAEIDAERDRRNMQALSDMAIKVQILDNKVDSLNETSNKQALESQQFQLNGQETLRLLEASSKELKAVKELLEVVRNQLVDFMQKALRQGVLPEAKDLKLLEETKADIKVAAADEAKEKEASGTPPAEPVAAQTIDTTQGETSS